MDYNKISKTCKQDVELEKAREEFNKRQVDEEFFKKQPINNKTWGLERLDRNLTKPKKDDFICFVGETGAGKTTYAQFMAIENAKNGEKVLFLSMEMSAKRMQERYIAGYAGITEDQRTTIDYTQNQMRKMAVAKKDIENENLHFLEHSHFKNPRDLKELIGVMQDYDMIFIDNFSFIVSRSEKEVSEQSKASETLLNFVNENKKTVILVHHYAKSNGNKRGLEARGSQKLIDDITTHASIMQDETTNRTYLTVTKNRFGEKGRCPIYYDNGKFTQ